MPEQTFPFRSDKAAQAAAVLLDAERSQRMAYYRLLKLLYLADREHLKATGRPIVGGRLVAMDKGPLHSAVYDLIKKRLPTYPEWSHYFRIDGRYIEMSSNPGNLALSRREIATLGEIAEQFADRDDDELGAATHQLPEYQKNHVDNTSKTIPLQDVIQATGRLAEADLILRDARETAVVDDILGGAETGGPR